MRVIAESLERITASIEVPIDYSVKVRERIADAHQRIVDAVGCGDAGEAYRAGIEHMREFRRYAERRYPGVLRQAVRWTTNTNL